MTIYRHKLSEDTKQVKIKKLEMLRDHYKQIADALSSNEVMAILEKWQGKQYNKRLETALKNIDSHFNIDTRFGFYLEYCFYNQLERSFKHGEHWIYIDNYKHTVKMLTKSSLLRDEKTICEDIAKQVLDVARYYQTQFEKLNNQLFKIDEYLQKMDAIVNEYNAFYETVDADIRQEFDMNLTTRN